MNVFIYTLGCKVNQYESQAVATLLTERGHTVVSCAAGADAIIINTCAVTAESGRKSRQAVRRYKNVNPDAVCVICGCWSQTSADEASMLGADVVFGSGDRIGLVAAVEKALADRTPALEIDEALRRRAFEYLPSGNVGERTRALLKIEDGCSNFCTYCIIPYARGPVRSMDIDTIRAEAQSLATRGFREIVVTGIEIASWGRDLKNGLTLADAVAAAAKAAPGVRLRLGSLEPRVIDEEFCRVIKDCGTVCRHFHLSLQSGCDETLTRMKRKYDTERFYRSVELLRRYFPGCGITADLITGFPGETEEEFEKTLSFIKRCAFSQMHVFPYSVRPGTPAAVMPGQVDKSVRQERAARASETAEICKNEFLYSQIGETLPVLFERRSDGAWQGHSDNYALVHAPGGEGLRNTVANVQIKSVKNGALWGDIIL